MKRKLKLLLAFMVTSSLVAAQNDGTNERIVVGDPMFQTQVEPFDRQRSIWNKSSQYIHLGFVSQSLKSRDYTDLKWKSDFGLQFSLGKTFYLHRKAIGNVLKFGLDWSFIDVNYAKYSAPDVLDNESIPSYIDNPEKDDFHQVDMGMHFGPSITINPVGYLKLSGWWHYAPTASIMIHGDNKQSTSFTSFFTVGGAISWKALSVGIEGRWGTAKFKDFELDSMVKHGYLVLSDPSKTEIPEKTKLKTKSTRLFLSFRF